MKRTLFLFVTVVLAAISCAKQEMTFSSPQWGEMRAEAESTGAVLCCSLSNSFGVVESYVLVSDGDMEVSHSATISDDQIVASVSGLKPETTYSFRFSISNGVFNILSPSSTFSTAGESPYINIPDPNFKAYLLENFDYDKDGLLSRSEALRVTNISRSTEDVKSVEGLGYFENLIELNLSGPEGGYGQLTELDLSNNRHLHIIRCERNGITSLDFSNNTELEEVFCGRNNLTALDVTMLPDLVSLGANDNRIEAIDLSNNSWLRYCNFSDNRLESFDVSNLIYAEKIHCGTDRLTEVYLPTYSSTLTELILDVNKLKECPDLAGYPNLERLYLFDNQIQTIDVSHNSNLSDFRCRQNSLYYLFLAENQEIEYITKNRSEEYISSTTELVRCGRELEISDPQFKRFLLEEHDYDSDGVFTYFDALKVKEISLFTDDVYSMKELRYFTNLEKLYCYGDRTLTFQTYTGGLKEIDVTRCPKLTVLLLSCNKLTTIPDLRNNLDLEVLDIGHNKLGGAINLNFLTKLRELHLGCNEIKRLTVSACKALKHITVHYNLMESVPDFTKNTNLVWLYMDCVSRDNFVTDKDYFTSLTELQELTICGYSGEQLDFSQNRKLLRLNIGDMSGMKEADLRYSPNLRSLNAKGESRTLERIYVNSAAPLDLELELNSNTKLIRVDN